MLVALLTALGQQDQIVDRLAAIAKAEPRNNDVRRMLAAARLSAGQLEQAEADYRELLKVARQEELYEGLLSIYRRGNRWLDLVKLLGDMAVDRDALELVDEQVKEIAKDPQSVASLIQAARHEYQADSDRLDYGDRMALALVALEARQFDTANEFFNLRAEGQTRGRRRPVRSVGRGADPG